MKRKRRAGFTMVELLVVILIITMLAALLTPRVFRVFGKSKQGLAQIGISRLGNALEEFYLDCGRYPTAAEGLGSLVTAPPGLAEKWGGRYMAEKNLLDPWDNPYQYTVQEGRGGEVPYVIASLGSDNAPGGEGEAADISSEEQ